MEISYDGMIPGGVIISVDHYENDEMSGRLINISCCVWSMMIWTWRLK